MKFFKRIIPLILGLFLFAGSTYAQVQKMQMPKSQADSITDQELTQFASVASKIQKLQQESKMTVDSLLEDEEMDSRRLGKIMMSKRNPKMADSVNITPQEKKTVNEIKPKLQKMQQESQKQLASAIQENGLTPQRFRQIGQAVRTNPEVRKRFQNMMQNNSMQK